MADAKIVKNQSSGYGYKYSNLADLHRAGVNIPKMRVKADEFGEFIEYYDEAEKAWQQGARIVLIESKQMNTAQAYGAALTYARRYTVQMAEKVACDDDDAIEAEKPMQSNKKTQTFVSNGKPTEKQLGFLKKLLKEAGKTDEEVANIASKCKTASMASAWIEKAKSLPTDVLPNDEEV